ncbi:reverse transcriptase domain-containing protein [Tanacetum coccineum]
MTDSQLPEEGVRRVIPEYRVTRPRKGSVTSFPLNNDHPLLLSEESPGQTDKVEEPDGTIQLSSIPSKKDAQTDEKGRGKRHDRNSPLRCRTRAQYIPSHRTESAKETEHNRTEEKTLKKVNMKLNPKKCSFGMVESKFLGYIVTSEGIRANPKKAKAVVNMPSPSNLKQMQRLSSKLAALNRFLSKAAERALPCLDTLRKCINKKDFYWTTEAEEAFQAMKKLIAELPALTAPKKEEELMVYLSAANEAISVVLLVEREGRQAPIHYVSRTLQGAKINYPPMEKLALALVHAATRRLAKWGVELEDYGIKYAPTSAIKGQVLADFLADTMAEDSPTQVKTKESNKILVERESMEEYEAMETKAPENLRTEAHIWKLYTNGASNEHG